MKKLIFVCLSTMIVTLSYSQSTIKATTDDGKKVELKSDGTWKYLDSTSSLKKTEDECNCEEIDEKKARKSGFLSMGESTAKDLKKHISVDIGCDIEKIKVISSSEQKGNAVYIVCVCNKKMKYRRVGSVFFKDGDKLF